MVVAPGAMFAIVCGHKQLFAWGEEPADEPSERTLEPHTNSSRYRGGISRTRTPQLPYKQRLARCCTTNYQNG